MNHERYETHLWEQNISNIIGIDEAGRGPIAGPLVVAGVMFPNNYKNDAIYDSKAISLKLRKQLFHEIMKDAIAYNIKIISPEEIDRLNIYRATQKAMEDIVIKFHNYEYVLTDAMPLNGIHVTVEPLIKGDQKSISIAAASILAKVTRDHIMEAYDVLYPEYGFAKHKGYPTKYHLQQLKDLGILSIHRKSYRPVALQSQLSFEL